MHKKILLINSRPKSWRGLDEIFSELAVLGFEFFRVGGKEGRNNEYKHFNFGPPAEEKNKTALFLTFLPIRRLWAIIMLGWWNWRTDYHSIVCFNLNEKLIFTPAARLLKIKIVWLELPNGNYRQLSARLVKQINKQVLSATVAAFGKVAGERLRGLGVPDEMINIIYPGIKLEKAAFQETIFKTLAQADNYGNRRKYFTIGAIMHADDGHRMENIFQAAKICQEVIPNIQILAVGDGTEKKNLSWLARKMDIENSVWFVGGQKSARKWLEGIDVYAVAAALPALLDFNNVLEAMAVGLPVIGPAELGLEDLIYQNKTGALIEMENSEMLARQIIKLYQDKGLRQKLGQMGRARAEEFFTIERAVDKMKDLL